MSESHGTTDGPLNDRESGFDIVERALAILDEEARAWLDPPATTPSEGHDR